MRFSFSFSRISATLCQTPGLPTSDIASGHALISRIGRINVEISGQNGRRQMRDFLQVTLELINEVSQQFLHGAAC